MNIHTVKENESIRDIARDYNISPIKLCEDNGLDSINAYCVGKELLILNPTRTYIVKKGDTLEKISDRFGVSVNNLLRSNPALMGRKGIYESQSLCIKHQEQKYGMIACNGYLYRGCPEKKLVECMPYLTYLTVCAAKRENDKITTLFDQRDLCEYAKKMKKPLRLRIYTPKVYENEGSNREFIKSAIVLAKSHGYDGIALSMPTPDQQSTSSYASFIFDMKKELMEYDLALFVEGDATQKNEYEKYADGAILTYDKLHYEKIPSFTDGEEFNLRRYAENCESTKAFLEIPTFAYSAPKYIPKQSIIDMINKRKCQVTFDTETLVSTIKLSGRREIFFESLRNMKAKLELISELGFMGISFDIMRISSVELLMASSLFSIVSIPSLLTKGYMS